MCQASHSPEQIGKDPLINPASSCEPWSSPNYPVQDEAALVAVLLEALTICHQQFKIMPLSIAQDMGMTYRMLLRFEDLERTEWMVRCNAISLRIEQFSTLMHHTPEMPIRAVCSGLANQHSEVSDPASQCSEASGPAVWQLELQAPQPPARMPSSRMLKLPGRSQEDSPRPRLAQLPHSRSHADPGADALSKRLPSLCLPQPSLRDLSGLAPVPHVSQPQNLKRLQLQLQLNTSNACLPAPIRAPPPQEACKPTVLELQMSPHQNLSYCMPQAKCPPPGSTLHAAPDTSRNANRRAKNLHARDPALNPKGDTDHHPCAMTRPPHRRLSLARPSTTFPSP
mmetsp:Transcript_78517/g.138731  ORF Transcript_78517/g.138731 Transcript_78517/m.138731 type:complete len:340 (-) Transcript_78517:30-1049(-)